jgi:hypothetical protein
MNEIAVNYLRSALGDVRSHCEHARAVMDAAKKRLKDAEASHAAMEANREALEQALSQVDPDHRPGAVIQFGDGQIIPAFS